MYGPIQVANVMKSRLVALLQLRRMVAAERNDTERNDTERQGVPIEKCNPEVERAKLIQLNAADTQGVKCRL